MSSERRSASISRVPLYNLQQRTRPLGIIEYHRMVQPWVEQHLQYTLLDRRLTPVFGPSTAA
jgi:hypothetical protein